MITSDIGEKLCQFVKEHTGDQYCLELLQFFGRYPHTRFSELAVVHALDGRKLYMERALKELTNQGLVNRCVENNVPLYWLTTDEPLHSLVLDLAKLDWGEWQLMLRQIYPHPVV
jgi:DNA-binding HxlR family transcriptional regulator